MRIAVISDVHGNADGLRAVLEDIDPHITTIVFAGDLVGYYPFVDECLRALEGRRVVGVRGNHDQMLIRCVETGSLPSDSYESVCGTALRRTIEARPANACAFLTGLPEKATVALGGRSMLLVHGSPWDPLEGRVYPDFQDWQRFEAIDEDIVVLGHTHYPFSRVVGNRLILNPGSVGQPRDRVGGASFAVLDLESLEVEFLRATFDASRLIEDARRHSPDVPYLTSVLERV